MAKPGDVIEVDGTEYVAGDDGKWRPNTSMAGQAVQAVTVDAPVNLLKLVQGGMNVASSVFQPGAPKNNFVPAAQRGYENLTRSIGVNVAPPQTSAQGFARSAASGLASAPMAMAGGLGVVPSVVSSVAGATASEAVKQAGGGPVWQFLAELSTNLLTSKDPRKTLKTASGAARQIANDRKINAWSKISPLDLADEGSAALMRQVDEAHKSKLATMEAAYNRVGKDQFPVSSNRLIEARDAILEEAGSINSPRAPGSILALLEEKIKKGKGTITLQDLRTLQKDVNAFLDTSDPTRTGLAQAQGMLRGKLVPAIQETMNDMIAAGEQASRSGLPFGPSNMANARLLAGRQKKSVEALKEANRLASEYYDIFDKRSLLTKELVDGVVGGQRLDPVMAFRKIFSDPKESVNYARSIMEVVGDSPANRGKMRRAFVEAVVGTDPTKFSAKSAHTQLNKMLPVAREVLGPDGEKHFRKLLINLEKNAESAASSPKTMAFARGAGALVGYATGGATPWIGGLLGAGIGDAAVRTHRYLAHHFGDAAAEQLAKEAFFDPAVYNMLKTNIGRFSQNQLAQFNSAARSALVRSGYRFTSGRQNAPMLPSEQNAPAPTEQELNRFRRQQ